MGNDVKSVFLKENVNNSTLFWNKMMTNHKVSGQINNKIREILKNIHQNMIKWANLEQFNENNEEKWSEREN